MSRPEGGVLRPVSLVVLLTLCAPAMAQDGEASPPPVNSEDVDREEAEFRRRMELEERAGDTRTVNPSTLPDIIDVIPQPGPLDHLPPESREHLEDELTELIIATGRWEPADASVPAPYTPSAAAQIDPELAAQEQAAWEGMVSAYHEREQAAFAGGMGSGGAGGSGQGSAGQGGTGQGGMGGSAGGQGAANGDSGAAGSAVPEERAPREPQDEAFNALEFLRQQGQPGAQTPAPDDPVAPAGGSMQSTEPAAADTTVVPSQERAGNGAENSGTQGQAREPEQGTEQAPGSEPVQDADQQAGQEADQSDPAPEPGQEDGEAASAEPGEALDGSLPLEALEALFPPASGPEAGNPESPAADSSEASEEAPASDTETPSEAGQPATAQPPETGFLAWLRRLFGGDDEESQEAEDAAADQAGGN